jgi:PAS domain S-box-containing protein
MVGGVPSIDPVRLFKDIFARASHPILVLDPPSDRLRYGNEAACSLLEYEPAELLVTPFSSIHTEEPSKLERFLSDVRNEGYSWTISLTLKTRAGSFLPTETTALSLDHDHRLYVLVLLTDVSEHRHQPRSQEPRSS